MNTPEQQNPIPPPPLYFDESNKSLMENWSRYTPEQRAIYLENEPHPPEAIATACGGNPTGQPANHAWKLEVITYEWKPPNHEHHRPGQWEVVEKKFIRLWGAENDLPQTIDYEGETLTVKKSDSHGICPECLKTTEARR